MSRKKANKALNRHLDNDGTITRDEMLKIVTAIFSMVGKKDGMSDQDPKDKVEKIFSLMDKVSFCVENG